MFESGDIIDPSDKFLEFKETGATLDSDVRSRRVDRWLAGGVIYAVSTLILAVSLGPWGGKEPVVTKTNQPASQQTIETAFQPRAAEKSPTGSSLAQSPPGSHPNGRSVVHIAQPQMGQVPAPGMIIAPLAKANNAAEPRGITSFNSIELEQNVSPVVEPAQVRPTPEAEAETPGVSAERVRVTTATNIHTGPSIYSDIIGAAHPGGEAVVASRESDWVQIVDPAAGKTGWIHSESLASSTENLVSTEAALQGYEVPDEKAQAATVQPKPRAKAKKYRSKRHFGRRGIRLRFVLRRLR